MDKKGSVDANLLTNTLNRYGKDGWEIKAAYTNELGKNALALMGLGVNSTVDQNILILQRFVKQGKPKSENLNEEIEKLKKLLSVGAISAEEYEKMIKEL